MTTLRLAFALVSLAALAIGCAASEPAAGAEPAPATLLGTKLASPPARVLSGSHLTGQIFVAGEALNFDVTFGAADTSAAAIARTVTAATIGSVIATDEAGHVRLTTSDAGPGVFLFVTGGDAAPVLGFSSDMTGEGS